MPRDTAPQDHQGVAVCVAENPFKIDNRKCFVAAGLSIKDMVGKFGRHAHVWIGPHKIEPHLWARVYPKEGATVTIRVVPQGGGGRKSIMSTVLSLALTVAAPGIGSALAGAIGFSGFSIGTVAFSGGQILGGLVGVVGRLAISSIFKPPSPRQPAAGQQDGQTLFVAGTQNQLLKWSTIPRNYGKMRMVPPYAALPYTETVGDDQYIRAIFCCGYGPNEVSAMRIGDTSLSEYSGVDVEIRKGYLTDDPLTLYTNTVLQNDINIYVPYAGETLEDSTGVSITGGNTINLPPGHGIPLDNLAYVKMSGWSTADNNEEFAVTAASGNTITIGGGGLTNDAGGEEVTIKFNYWYVQTSDLAADEIITDLTLPQGLVKFQGTTKISQTVQAEVQYSVTGTGVWSNSAVTYTAVSAQESPDLGKPSGSNKSQYWRVYLDPADGSLGAVEGAVLTGAGVPEEPIIPAGMLPIAKVLRRSSDSDQIAAGDITDERDPAQIGDYFEAAADFAPTPTGQNDEHIAVAAGGLAFPGIKVTDKRTAAIRKEVRFIVGGGQYDVRVRRVTDDATSDQVFDKIYWTAVRTIRNTSPILKAGMTLIALRIKATDQLNGVLNNFNCVVSSILPIWDGADWNTEEETSNPAAIYRDIITGRANARALATARLDATAFEEFYEDCETEEFFYNGIFDSQQSVWNAAQQVVAVARATPRLADGLWSILRDQPQTVAVQHFTPRNSWGFNSNVVFSEQPHVLRVQFFNEALDWQQDEVLVYADGYTAANATKSEALFFPGITDAVQAWKAGRYFQALAKYQPEQYVFFADAENIVCTRGDLIRLSHDVILGEVHSGRIASLATSGSDITGITIDETVSMLAGRTYGVRIRLSDGSELLKEVTTVAGDTSTLTFTTAFAVSSGVGVDDIFSFGEYGSETIPCVVKKIDPAGDITAKITCVDYNANIYLADQGAVPPHVPTITLPYSLATPPQPVVVNVQSGTEALELNPDGSYGPTIMITLQGPNWPEALTVGVLIQVQGSTSYYPANFTVQSGLIRIREVEAGEIYNVQISYKTAIGRSSIPAVESGIEVTGGTGAPADVQDFFVNVQGAQANLTWTANTDIITSHYYIRWTEETDPLLATWESAVDLVLNVAGSSITVPALAGTYLIKAVSFGGLMSVNATKVPSTIAELLGFNVVATITEDPDFGGTHDGTATDGTGLILAGSDSIDDWADVDAVANFDIGEGGLYDTGTYDFEDSIDLGDVYTSRLTASISVEGLSLTDNIDTVVNFDLISDMDSGVDPSQYRVTLQLRKTDDDPAGTPTWTSWMDFVVGDYTARAFEFRVVLESLEFGVSPRVLTLSVTVDMPDIVQAENGLSSVALGSTFNFPYAFKAIPALGVTGQNMATGDYFTISSVTVSGFTIRFFNSAGTGVVRTFDYLAKGYGRT